MIKKGCRIGVVGLGKSTLSLINSDIFKESAITVRSNYLPDLSVIKDGVSIDRVLYGEQKFRDIDEDILLLSPSVRRDDPQLISASQRGVMLSSDCEIFFSHNKQPVYAVTGSDGKSTTATLTHLLLQKAGRTNGLIGNIGNPMCESLFNYDSYVCELSSFMLSYISPISKASCITCITPNHLDWHRSFEEYRDAKLKILKNTQRAVLGDEFKSAYAIVSTEKSFIELKESHEAEIFLTYENGWIIRNGIPFINKSQILRKETHNVKNLMMAIALTDGETDKEHILKVAGTFSGLEHRCRLILQRDGIDYFDSSVDSTPDRTVKTLCSLDRDAVIILGGRSKGLDYRILTPYLKKYARQVIITGENAKEIFRVTDPSVTELIPDFKEAVIRGVELSKNVGTLLLSPASTSYDRFKNFEERGRYFKEIILNCK